MLKNILYGVYIVIAIALTVVVLCQESKQSGLTGAISGAAETYWSKNKSRSKEGILAIVTTILAVLFIGLSLVFDLVLL